MSDKFDKHAPQVAKEVVVEAQRLVLKASKAGETLVCDGPSVAMQHAAYKYKHLMLSKVVTIWFVLNKVALFHVVADMAVPTAAYWTDKYNHVITYMSGKGYTIFGYFPIVPIDEIARTFKQQDEAGKQIDYSAAAAASFPSSSDSD